MKHMKHVSPPWHGLNDIASVVRKKIFQITRTELYLCIYFFAWTTNAFLQRLRNCMSIPPYSRTKTLDNSN